MVRLSKQGERRHVSYKKPKLSGEKSAGSGQRTERKIHKNAVPTDQAFLAFIPTIC